MKKVLHRPSNDNFPAVEIFYESEEGNLMALQVTRMKEKEKGVKVSAYEKFNKTVNLQDSAQVILHLIHTPAMAENSSTNFVPPSVEIMPECRAVKGTEEYTRKTDKVV